MELLANVSSLNVEHVNGVRSTLLVGLRLWFNDT